MAAYCAGVLGSTPAASPSTTTHGRSAHPSKSPRKLKEPKPRKSGKPGKRAAGRAAGQGRL